MMNRAFAIGFAALLGAGLLVGCESSKDVEARKAIAERAKQQISECQKIGSNALMRSARVLVWDLTQNSPHAAHTLLNDSLKYDKGPGPLTVFLVSGKRSQQMGTYSISHQPAFREWLDVFIVEFPDPSGPGKAVGSYELVSLDPRSRRPVQYSPEHGDPAPPLRDWINRLAERPK